MRPSSIALNTLLRPCKAAVPNANFWAVLQARMDRDMARVIAVAHKRGARALLAGDPCAPSLRAIRVAERWRRRFVAALVRKAA